MASTLRERLQDHARQSADVAPQSAAAAPAKGVISGFGPAQRYEYDKEVAEQYDVIADGLPDNGRVLRNKQTGQQVYVSSGMSTADPDVVSRALIIHGQMKRGVETAPEQYPRQMEESDIRQEIIQKAGLPGAMGQKFAEGELFTGSTVDERTAALKAYQTGRPYEEVLQQARGLSRATQAEYPVASEVAKVGGMLTSLVPLNYAKNKLLQLAPGAVKKYQDYMDQAPPLQQQGARIAGASTAAGAEGLVYGFGEGEDFEGRSAKALERGGLQAVITLPVSAVLTTAGRIIDARRTGAQVANEVAQSLGVSTETARIISQAMDDGRTLKETIDLLRKAGKEGMIADATRATKELLDTAANMSGKASDIAEQNIEGRIGRQSGQLTQEMDVALGQPKPPGQTVVETVSQRSAPARSAAYKKAYEQEINWASDQGQKLTAVLGRLSGGRLQKMMDEINEIRLLRGDPVIDMRLDVASDGTFQWVRKPTVEQLDALKKDLGDMAQEMTNEFGQLTGKGKAYQQYALELRDAIADVAPGYKQAVAIGGQGIAEKKAAEMGEALLKGRTSLDDVIAQLRNATGDELAAAKLGLRNAIDNIIGDAKKAASASGDIENKQMLDLLRQLSSGTNRQKVREVLGNDVADPLFKQMDELSQSIQMRSVLGGSQTATRTAGREAIDAEVQGGVLTSLFNLMPAKFSESLRDILTNKSQYMADRRNKVTSELVELLTGRTGREAELAIKYVKEAIENGQVSAQKAAIIAKEADKAMYQALPGIEYQRYQSED